MPGKSLFSGTDSLPFYKGDSLNLVNNPNFAISIIAQVDNQSITGILLAGGQSKRMGTDKGLMKINGIPMIRYVMEVMEKVCTQILISSGDNEYKQFGYPVIPDIFPIQASIAGMYSGLLASKTNGNLVVSCDMPLIRREILEFLLSVSPGYDMVVPVHPDGLIEPFCGYYHKQLVAALHQQIEKKEYSLQVLAKRVTCRCIPLEDFGFSSPERYFRSINSPEDIRLYEQEG